MRPLDGIPVEGGGRAKGYSCESGWFIDLFPVYRVKTPAQEWLIVSADTRDQWEHVGVLLAGPDPAAADLGPYGAPKEKPG
jgi:hypothetical protein